MKLLIEIIPPTIEIEYIRNDRLYFETKMDELITPGNQVLNNFVEVNKNKTKKNK